jgi:hypothetical protein
LLPLALGDEVVLAQELFRGLAKGLFCFDFAVAELAAKLQIPVLRDLFGSREAIFLRGCPAVFPAEVGGTLPAAAVRAFVNVNLSAEERVVFCHGSMPPSLLKSSKMCKSCATGTPAFCY